MNSKNIAPMYSPSGVRLAPYSARELFMLDRANGATSADRYRAWHAGAATRPTYRWQTANEQADQAEAAEMAAEDQAEADQLAAELRVVRRNA